MDWWRKLVAILGLSRDARVNVRARGIDVTIIGDADEVRSMLAVVKDELENRHRRRLRARSGSVGVTTTGLHTLNTDSQVVRPTELDEMDSPYAIPEHRTVPPGEEDTPTGEMDATPQEPMDIRDTLAPGTAPGIDDLPDADAEVTAVGRDPSEAIPMPEVIPQTRPDSQAIVDEREAESRVDSQPAD